MNEKIKKKTQSNFRFYTILIKALFVLVYIKKAFILASKASYNSESTNCCDI